MSAAKKPTSVIPFAVIEKTFELARIGHSPAVGPDTPDGYYVRVWAGETRRRDGSVTSKYDYFYIAADGTVRVAPRGFAKDFKPGRITGMDDAVTRYALEVR